MGCAAGYKGSACAAALLSASSCSAAAAATLWASARLMAVFFCEAGYVLEIGLSSGGGRGWRDGVSLLSCSWFLREV